MSNMDTVEEGMPSNNDITDVEFREVPTEPVAEDQPLSLAETITMMMEEAGVVDPMYWMRGLNREALLSPDLNVQRYLINRHWRGLLTQGLTVDQIKQTINARGCLQDGRWELTDWISHFKKDVLPCAIKIGVLTTHPSEPAPEESTKSDSANSDTASSSSV